MHDHHFPEARRLIQQPKAETDTPICGAGCPLRRHPLDLNATRTYAKLGRPVENLLLHPFLRLLHCTSHDLGNSSRRLTTATMTSLPTAGSTSLYTSAFNCRSSATLSR